MDAREANVLLTRLRLLDPRFARPMSEEAARVAAETWAEVLHDVALTDALAAAVAHYRESPLQLMPSDIVSRCAAVVAPDREALEARARWLAERGLSEADLLRMSRVELERLVRGNEVTL